LIIIKYAFPYYYCTYRSPQFSLSTTTKGERSREEHRRCAAFEHL